ncbi:MAG TPA: permease [Syntrophales bacterium]|jgi:hypothetical protein|nr:permease [Syntrophales bacterium]HQA82628.1 permease [Syntrophales bacterium]
MFGINNFVVAGKFFLIITGELILIFVAVSFIIGLLTEYLPPSRIRDFLSNKLTWVQYLLGSGLGALTPFCSCSTVPITAGLLKGGVPFGPTMAFLFSSPVLNPVIIALLLSLFGYQVTFIYAVVTFCGSMVVAALMSKMGMDKQIKPLMNFQASCCTPHAIPEAIIPEHPLKPDCCSAKHIEKPEKIVLPMYRPSEGCCAATDKAVSQIAVKTSCCAGSTEVDTQTSGPLQMTFKDKMKRASASAIDTFKGVFWYLLLGAGIGAFIYGFFPQDLVIKLAGPGNPWSIPIAAILGVPMYIRAETVIPISAALVAKGMGVGTVLALIVAGAGASIPEMIILGSMFKKKLIAAFVLNVFLVAVAAGYLVDILLY